MIDRLISGAGAVADLVNRGARRLVNRGRGGGITGDKPVAAIVGAVLLGLAGYATAQGLEANVNPEPRELDAADVQATEDFGSRTYVTVSGEVSLSYVETYRDTNDNGRQDDNESGQEWFYYLVDPVTFKGVAVRSDRRPQDVYRVEAAGTLVEDPEYIAPDLEDAAEVLAEANVFLDPDIYLDATGTAPANASPLAFGAPWLAGEEVTVEGVAIGWYSWCTTDVDNDGSCSTEEIDMHDLIVYDPGTLQAIVVAVDVDPTFADETFTGMLRRDPDEVASTRNAPGQSFSSLGISISPDYYLAEGQVPADPTTAFGAAIVLAILGGVLLIGAAGGYLVFRRQTDARSTERAALELGESIPLRVTGRLVTPTGFLRVREVPAVLQRVTLLPITAAPELFVPPPGWVSPDGQVAGASGAPAAGGWAASTPAAPSSSSGEGIPGWVPPDSSAAAAIGAGLVGWVSPETGSVRWAGGAPAAAEPASAAGGVPSRDDWIRSVADLAPATAASSAEVASPPAVEPADAAAAPAEPAGPAAVVESAHPVAPTVMVPNDAPTDPASVAPVRTTLIVERIGQPEGIAVGAGETKRLSVGRVVPFRGERAAIRLETAAGPLLLSFDDEGMRDRAATELVTEAGLTRQGDGTATRVLGQP